jgi:hypothetical protein
MVCYACMLYLFSVLMFAKEQFILHLRALTLLGLKKPYSLVLLSSL